MQTESLAQSASIGNKTLGRPAMTIVWLMALSAAFSLFFLATQSLRLDEAQSLWQVSNSLPRVLNIVAQDVHVPLYHVLLHLWTFYTGNEVWALRLFSLIFMTLTIPLVYILGKKIFNEKIGMFAAVLTALSPFLVWYGSEIRMYSLLVFLTVINHIFFWDAAVKNKGFSRWFLYALTGILAAYTHYFFLLVLVSQFVFYLFFRAHFPAGTLSRLISTFFLIGLSLAPWLYYIYSLSETNYSEPLLAQPTVINLFITFTQFLFGFQSEQFNRLFIALWPIAVLFGFLSLAKKQRYSAGAFYLLVVTAFPTLAAFLVSIFITPVFLSRYLILAVPSLFLFIAWLFYHYPNRAAKAFRYSLVTVMAAALLNQAVSAYTPTKENYKDVALYLEQNANTDDMIMVSAPFTIYPLEYYYTGNSRIVTMPEWNRFEVGPIAEYSESELEEKVESLRLTHRRMFVVLSYDQGYEDNIRLYLDRNLERIEKKEFSNGLEAYIYRLRYDV
jgi:mannosyltransferase